MSIDLYSKRRRSVCELLSDFPHPAWAAIFLFFFLGSCGRLSAASPTTVECGSVPSVNLHRAVGYCIDLPADYASTAPKRYPALYFLHGLFGNDHCWADRGRKGVFDRLTAKGTIGKFLVVMPDGG